MATGTPQYAQVSLLLTMLCSFSDVAGFGGGYGGYKYYTTKKSKCLNPPRTARRVESFIGECQEEVKNKLVSEAYQILKEEISKERPKVTEHDDYAFDSIEETHEKPGVRYPNDLWLPTPVPSYHKDEHQQAANYNEQHIQSHYDDSDYDDATRSEPEYETHNKRAARLIHRTRRISDVSHGTGIYHPTLVPYEDKRIAGCLLHCVYAKNDAIDKHGWPTLDGLVDFYSEGVNEHGFFMATLRSVNLCLRAITNKYHVDRRKLPEQGESCDLAFDVFDCISDQLTGYCLDQYE